ncbi:WD40-repeat-containing domain protein [Suillus plorans]|uniref:WD40-repeat-containing domain protein n=1 Tax=Suillus plorans TaxID=116603 RepID=A0A9P7AI86_9AGAM|nr:WD40-repeat-containing domain protein [Suillus plorans]KAG1789921.1 WD40-repeat-containing domain protein [Suillus plorans]
MAFNNDIIQMITRRTSHLTSEVKAKVRPLVESIYGFESSARESVKSRNRQLAQQLKHKFGLCYRSLGDKKKNLPRSGLFQTKLTQKAANLVWYCNKKDEGIVFAKYFTPFAIPAIALCYTAAECCIDEWADGERVDISFSGDEYKEVYAKHLANLNKFNSRTKDHGILDTIQKEINDVGRHAKAEPIDVADDDCLSDDDIQHAIEEFQRGSEDNDTLVSGSVDESIRVWDIGTGEVLGAPLQGHTSTVGLLCCNLPDGTHVVFGSHDRTIRVRDIHPRDAFGTLLKGHTGWVQSIAISLDGNRIVSGSSDRTTRVWDMESSEAVGDPLKGHSASVLCVAISQDGKHIVSGSTDTTVQVWDIGSGRALGAPLQGHTDYVRSAAFSRNGHHIVSGSDDKSIRVWDMKTGQGVGPTFQGHTGIRMRSKTTIRVWDIEFLNQPHPSKVPAVMCFSHNPFHALHSASSFLQDFSTPVSVATNKDGWVVGPDGHLLWISPILHPAVYASGNTIVPHKST